MNIKKTLLAAALASGVFGTQALAADGTIYFEGKLTATTCDITVDGQASPATVVLPEVSTSLLQTLGETTADTGFSIELANCTGVTSTSTAAAFFENGSTVDTTTYNLLNTDEGVTDGATNVQLQLLDQQTEQPLQVGNTSQTTNTTRIDMSSGSASLPYTVRYYAMGATTPGTVKSQVNFSIDYE
ncbi:fimbrial protein [Jejubacter calystegiae]|uniref:fimbrial protein n=1 Tax=Jejubacter TaxID=2815296 RepID=UPI001F4F91D0|nr:fimbrial protein [Jejubacter calystegiae]